MTKLYVSDKFKWEREWFVEGDLIEIPDNHPRLEAMMIGSKIIPTSLTQPAKNSKEGRIALLEDMSTNPGKAQQRFLKGDKLIFQDLKSAGVDLQISEAGVGDGSPSRAEQLSKSAV